MTSSPTAGALRRARRRAAAGTRLLAIRAQMGVLGALAPGAADRRAFDLWCTLPPGSRLRRDLSPSGGTIVRLPVPRGGAAVAEVWGEGSTVYLVHGWGGWRGQLGAFVAPLVEAGHRVVAVDAPGHGDAPPGFLGPDRGTVIEFADALAAAVDRFGPAAAAVGHSMGTIVVAEAVASGVLTADRLVLVAPAHGFDEVLDRFSRVLWLTRRTREHLQGILERYTGRPIGDFDLERIAASAPMPPVLLVHDRDDRETPYEVAVRVLASWPDARLVTTEGLGHHRVLKAPAVIDAVVAHVTGGVAAARA